MREHLRFHDVLAHYGIDEHGNGDQIKIICPFHNDHKPSCGVNLEKQVYNCFVCDAGGNALDFVANMEGFDPSNTTELRKAAMHAANTFGIDQALERPSTGRAKAKSKTTVKAKAKSKPVKAKTNKAVPVNDREDKPSNPPITIKLKLDPKHPFIQERGFKTKLIKKFGIGLTFPLKSGPF